MTIQTLPREEVPAASTGTPEPVGRAAIPKFRPSLTEEEAVTQARLLKALADPHRLRILSLLSRHEGEVCVYEMVESFALEQPTVSHHLRLLRDAGLVECRKKGLWAYYYVCRERLTLGQQIVEALFPHASAE